MTVGKGYTLNRTLGQHLQEIHTHTHIFTNKGNSPLSVFLTVTEKLECPKETLKDTGRTGKLHTAKLSIKSRVPLHHLSFTYFQALL